MKTFLLIAVSTGLVLTGCSGGADQTAKAPAPTSAPQNSVPSQTPAGLERPQPVVDVAELVACTPAHLGTTERGWEEEDLSKGRFGGVLSIDTCDDLTIASASAEVNLDKRAIHEVAAQIKNDMCSRTRAAFAAAVTPNAVVRSDSPTVAILGSLEAYAAQQSGEVVSCGVAPVVLQEFADKAVSVSHAGSGFTCTMVEDSEWRRTALQKKAQARHWTCSETGLAKDFDAITFQPGFRTRIVDEVVARRSDTTSGFNLAYGSHWLIVSPLAKKSSEAGMTDEEFMDALTAVPVLGTASKGRPATDKPATRPEDELQVWNDELDYRWLEPGEFTCDYGDKCWAIQVQATTGCTEGIYAEMNFANAKGVVVDWSNATVPVLAAGQSANLVFATFDPKATNPDLVTLRCWTS